MPANGKHRRTKTQRFARSIAVAGTGGAAFALPLLGATGAHAASAPSLSGNSVQSSVATTAKKSVAEKATAEKKGAARTYVVRVGDYLAKIAKEQNVSGGWQKLYHDNREAIGDNPALIHPGLKLTIGKKATTGAEKPASAPKPKPKPASLSSSSSKKSAATAQSAATTSTASGFTLPVSGATIGTAYHVAGSMWASGYHTGVDFVVPTGTPLKAVGAGTVVSAGWGGAYGNQVVVKLADGYYAQYAHLSSLSVSSGQTVTVGQQIGLSGATGNVTGPHLHFEIRTTPDYGSDVDPIAYLRSKGVSVG